MAALETVETRREVSMFSKVLPDDLTRASLQAIPRSDLLAYEKALDGVLRWQDAHAGEYTRQETVLEHVVEMLEFVNTIEHSYPELAAACNLNELRLMILLHEAGEPEFGDTPYTAVAKEGVAHTSADETNAALKLLGHIKKQNVHDLFVVLYQRHLKREPTDIEAHLFKFIDVAQGELLGAEHVFPFRKKHGVGYQGCGDVPAPEYYVKLCTNVLQALGNNEPAKRDFKRFAEDTLLRAFTTFENFRYPDEGVDQIRGVLRLASQ